MRPHGPITDSLGTIEGYLLLQGNSLEEAAAIAEEFPGLAYAARVAQFAHLWTMRDGLILRLQQCADTAQLAKALRKDFSKEQT
jgi:hypothetical protein